MHHYFESITNTYGDSLPGYFARVIDQSTQNTVALAADNNGTPIVTVSGVENMAKTDIYGNISFYVEPGTYRLDIYYPNTTSLAYSVPDVAMNSGKGPPGEDGEPGGIGPQGPVGPKDYSPKSAINSFLPLLTWLTSYNQATGGQTLFYDFGSSVGNGAALGDQATTQNPGAYFFTRAKAFFDPTNIYDFSRNNGSVDGSILLEMRNKWVDTIAPTAPKVSFGVPGMNDFQISGFNTGETFNPTSGSPAFLRDLLRKAQQVGCLVVLSTTPHPHVDRLDYDFFANNPGVPMAYPTFVSGPVPASAVIPSKTNAIPTITWKGVPIRVDARFLRGNEMIRRVAAEFGVPVIDAERKQFDLLAAGYTYTEMYGDAEIVHPNLWAIQQTYHAAIDDLFDGMANDGVLSAQPSAIGPRLGVNADETMPYVMRVAPTNGDGIALFEKQDGTDALTIDAAGNVDQVAGDTIRLAPKLLRRSGRDPSLGVPQDGFSGEANTSAAQSITVPPNSHGIMWVGAFRSDLGRRTALVTFYADQTTVTIGPDFGAVGEPVTPLYSRSVSGLTATFTPTGANTTLKIRLADAW